MEKDPIIIKENSEKTAQDEKLKEITEKLEQGIKDLFDSEKYRNFLNVMSKFHNYSFNNSLLIAMQKPEATLVAGFKAWQTNFDRHVQKGERGIHIIAPAPYKIEKDVEKIDPETNKPIIGKNGQPLRERVQVLIPAYKVTTVFDVSQTEGKELPELATELKEDVKDYGRFLGAIKETSPVPIEFIPISGSTYGYYHLEDKKIAVREGMSEQQTLKTCIHEVTHAILHDKDSGKEKDNLPDQRTKEVEAESVAYTVCQHFGIDTSEYSFGYVASWSSGKELEELRASMNIIRSTAAEIINSVEKKLCETREQVKDKKQQKTKEQSAKMAAGQTRKTQQTKASSHGRYR